MNLLHRLVRPRQKAPAQIKSLAELSDVWQFIEKPTVQRQDADDFEALWLMAQREVALEENRASNWLSNLLGPSTLRGSA